MEELILKIDNLKKEYKLGQIGGTTLRDELQRLHAKIHKKEDPTRKIGEKNYNQGEKFLALDGISFEVKKGERIGIIGHNGAGKSTLLKLISRITAPTNGTISLNGRVASMLEVGTGFHPELTGRENVYMNGAILGMTKKEIDTKMEDIIEFSEVRQFIDTPVKRYSSGMYVKLAFSVAAHLNSEIVIMDEVLAVGDMAFQNKCIEKMKDLANSGRTVLYVSHNMDTIRNLCNRCIVLSKGKLVYDGDVETSISYYISENFKTEPTIDLANNKRLIYCSHKVKMTQVSILERDSWHFRMGETMKFRLSLTSEQIIEQLTMRIGIWSANGNAIGVSFSNHFRCEKEGVVEFFLDISRMLPGKYSLEYMLVEVVADGTLVTHDRLREAVFFEITIDPCNALYNKSNSSWGYYSLPATKANVIM